MGLGITCTTPNISQPCNGFTPPIKSLNSRNQFSCQYPRRLLLINPIFLLSKTHYLISFYMYGEEMSTVACMYWERDIFLVYQNELFGLPLISIITTPCCQATENYMQFDFLVYKDFRFLNIQYNGFYQTERKRGSKSDTLLEPLITAYSTQQTHVQV